jgi:hypothetical protein
MNGRITRSLLAVLMPNMLGGCIALPVPAFYVSARRNIEAVVPDFVVPGETTRAEVLMTLGMPDIVTDDDEEFIYLVVRSRAGVWMTYGWRDYSFAKVEYRQLDLSFDHEGAVASASVATGLCEDSEESATCGRVRLSDEGMNLAEATRY